MLSYQHGYHAGNFADVIKHTVLLQILRYMVQKEKPLLYLDTHAGCGLYDLKSPQALKTGEAAEGIALLFNKRNELPAPFLPYLKSIQELNQGEELRYYPGSPWLAMHALRSDDRLVFADLHPHEYETLELMPRTKGHVFYHNSNGLDLLRSLLPPIERRGLIFIDPSYEIKTDYRDIPALIQKAYQRFATGTYCLWYPLVDNKLHGQLIRGLEQVGANQTLRLEFYLTKKHQGGMSGCGLWIINPPFVLAKECKTIFETLRALFNPEASSYLIEPSKGK